MDMVGYSRTVKQVIFHSIDRQYLIAYVSRETALLYHLLASFSRCHAVMRTTTGKTFNYMHLDPKLWDEKEKHLNKKYKEET
jgi:hypothetical protein